MGRVAFLAAAGLLLAALGAAAVPSSAAPSEPDDRVTPAITYVRHDGGTDRAIQHCWDPSTSTAPDVPGDGDTDSNDGGAFRQGNEPTVAIDPTNGDVWVATYGAQPHASGYPKDYLRTVIVGQGSPALNGIFSDKPELEADRTGGRFDGNVYICWSRFVGFNGRTKISFSRSTDHGQTFSKPIELSFGKDVQGCDIAIEHDGDVYVAWGTRNTPSVIDAQGMAIARSTDGGASFEPAHQIATFTRYFPSDGDRNCGDGALTCPSQFVFFRVPLEPRITADQSGMLPGVYATYNAVDPATVVPSTSSYSSAGPNSGFVGRSVVYVIRSTNNGNTWSGPITVDPGGGRGHQYFSDIDALGGKLVAVWQDNRTDDAYSVQLPIGNTRDAQGRPVSSGTDVTGTYASVSDDGVSFTPVGAISSATHQPSYEMFSNRQLPFQGDYNYVALAFEGPSLFGYMAWTDNRDVLPGVDIRETDYVDGFDVHQCRTPMALEPDRCPNAHGLDQNIYGQSLTAPVG